MQIESAKFTRLLLVVSFLLVTGCDNSPAPPTPTRTAPITEATQTSLTFTATSPAISPTIPTTSQVLRTISPTGPPPSPATQTPTPQLESHACIDNAAHAGQDGLGDTLYPTLGNSGYDALHYTLDLSVDVASNVVSGTSTMRAQASKPLSSFNLDFEKFNISAITVNGAVAGYSQQGEELAITPTTELRLANIFTVTVAYRGTPNTQPNGSILGDKEYAPGWSHYRGGTFVASEPSGAASFFPANDHPCDKALYTFRITVPKPYIVAANGTLKEKTDNGQLSTYLFETRDPMASYLVTIDIAKFDLQTEQGPGGLPIRNYFEKGIDTTTRDYFKRTPEMIQYFSTLFGPYPFDVYGAVVLDEPLGFAIETQTLSLFGQQIGSSRVDAEQVVAHELSHMWFGDSVSLSQWRDIWLNEGFASMSEWLWIEHTQGKAAYDSYVRGVYRESRNSALSAPGNPTADDLFSPSVYLRGGLTLYALRKEIGDDSFFKTLQVYASHYRNSNATTQDFISVAQEISGKKLGDFFNNWLYSEAMPSLP